MLQHILDDGMTPVHITMMQERGISGMAALLCVHTMLQAFGV